MANDDGSFRTGAQRLAGTYHTHPRFGPHFGDGDPHDIAVVVLENPYNGAIPASLPTLNELGAQEGPDRLAVHRGRLRRRARDQAERARTRSSSTASGASWARASTGLTKIWLKLTMNPLKGSGGTCFGDSGGPHFAGTGGQTYPGKVVALTVGGDGACRSTDVDYRLDTRLGARVPRRFRDSALSSR